jgi:hypothetical protein
MKHIFLAVSFFHSLLIFPQIPEVDWQRTYGGSGADVPANMGLTNDGGYILVGSTTSTNGDVKGLHPPYWQGGASDAWVLKLDLNGAIQWEKCLGGNMSDEGLWIQQTKDGGYIMIGTTTSNDGDVTGNHGQSDMWVVKLLGTGEVEWQKCYGGTKSETGKCVKETTDGGYILYGTTTSTNGDVTVGQDQRTLFWLVKITHSGDIVWQNALRGRGSRQT